jgi:von Willebrand factor type A C-terminal domain/von Willebrand factor type A domain
MNLPGFTLECFQNEYLPNGAREVHALVTVSSAATADGAPATADGSAAEIIIIDCSGSMSGPKIEQARRAAQVAVETIRDGVAFAVIAGTETARLAYPGRPRLATMNARTRPAATKAIRGLKATDGTAAGAWLHLAHRIFGTRDATLRHAIMLTDGYVGGPTLQGAIALCEGVFTCDCRGVGTDWHVDELRKISTALLGTVDIVADPQDLAADFQAMTRAAMDKQVADVMLRIRTPRHATVRFVKQTAPSADDLTGRRTEAGPQTGDYPTGAWGRESRDYHVCVEVAPAAVGQEMLAARVSLVTAGPSGPQILGEELIRAVWTDDLEESTRVEPRIAHAADQVELAEVIRAGLEARRRGDEQGAVAKLGRAVALAHESGHEDTARLLAGVVDVVDAATGTVRLKARVSDADEMTLDVRSTKTVRVKK